MSKLESNKADADAGGGGVCQWNVSRIGRQKPSGSLSDCACSALYVGMSGMCGVRPRKAAAGTTRVASDAVAINADGSVADVVGMAGVEDDDGGDEGMGACWVMQIKREGRILAVQSEGDKKDDDDDDER